MSKKEKDYKKRLKHIHEDVLKLSKCLPDIDYDISDDWESINRFISDIEVASDIKNNESESWKTKFKIPTHDPQTGELNPYFEELTGKKNPLTGQIEKKYDPLPFCKEYFRIIGYCFIPFNLVVATILLVFSEVIGIVEEMV